MEASDGYSCLAGPDLKPPLSSEGERDDGNLIRHPVKDGFIVRMPAHGVISVDVEVDVARVWVSGGAGNAKTVHDLGGKFVDPRWEKGGVNGTTTILVRANGEICSKPSRGPRPRAVGASRSYPRGLVDYLVEPEISPLEWESTWHLGDESSVQMIVQDRLPWGRRVRYSVSDWGRLVTRQDDGRGEGEWEERGGWLAARRTVDGCIEEACGRGAEFRMALVSCRLWTARLIAFRFTVDVPVLASAHRGDEVPLVGRGRRSVSRHNRGNELVVISNLM